MPKPTPEATTYFDRHGGGTANLPPFTHRTSVCEEREPDQMAAAQARWGNLLLSQDKSTLYDVRNFRLFRVEEGEFNDATGAPAPWNINGYYNRKDAETLASYHDEQAAKDVFNDLCCVLWNGEISDFTLPIDQSPKGTPTHANLHP